MKNFSAVDPFIQRIKKFKEKLIPPWILSSHMSELYAFAKREYERWLRESYPSLVNEQTGEFIGAMTTNAMEAGNWRIKYELRADYQRDESIEARCILIALRDSMKTFKNGMPKVSFASMNSEFEYGMIMEATTMKKMRGTMMIEAKVA